MCHHRSGKRQITEEEQHGTCKTLLQVAAGSIASSVYGGLARLCSSTGRKYQSELHKAILDTYDGSRDKIKHGILRFEKRKFLWSYHSTRDSLIFSQ